MATALDIITAALQKIGVVGKGQTPDGADGKECLDVLNRVLSSYEARGCDIINPQMSIADYWTAGDKYLNSIIDVLAYRLAKPYGVAIDAVTERDYQDADRLILKHFITRAVYGVDNALVRLGTSSRFDAGII